MNQERSYAKAAVSSAMARLKQATDYLKGLQERLNVAPTTKPDDGDANLRSVKVHGSSGLSVQEIIAARVKAARIKCYEVSDERMSKVADRIQAAITDCAAGILEEEKPIKQLDAYEMIRDLAIDIGAALEEHGVVIDGEEWAGEGIDVDLHSPSDVERHESLGGQDSYRDRDK